MIEKNIKQLAEHCKQNNKRIIVQKGHICGILPQEAQK